MNLSDAHVNALCCACFTILILAAFWAQGLAERAI